ncbi:adenylyl-sulfate reductase [Caldichromatium japonicum]|uniref:Adenylyl-sulfate reductase n=1 Tax=Caldichromatium japonicum TaxID=2699430 RepID=A0A6G7VC01_9GAMM|nr:adenylyl-sulfate reductase [Caldichromatium japonicum]QIK37405.1 adenylyl-sulfate reductase [Caldichromatium japonicum]
MNPFAELSATIPPSIMQLYVVLMILLVISGTLLDIMHKKSAQYFFEKGQTLKKLAKRELSGGEKISIALATLVEVLTSGEFDNPDRRKSHLMLMYGFIVFVVTTALLIFGLPGHSSFLTGLLWHLGALSVCVGGYWFWFKIRVDVRSEGHPWHDVHLLADLFIVSLLLMTTFALAWSVLQGIGLDTLAWIAFFIFIAAATTLFGTVFWSKFAHMFYKPAAAFQKKIAKADGSMDKLPEIPDDLSSPFVKERYPDIPKYMGDTPPYMGLGIRRETPTHF